MIRYAPFSEEEIDNLSVRQAASWFHPYICGKDSVHGDLLPTPNGWVCPCCDYTQDWAHDFDVDGRWVRGTSYVRRPFAPNGR